MDEYNAQQAAENLRQEFETFRHQYTAASQDWEVKFPVDWQSQDWPELSAEDYRSMLDDIARKDAIERPYADQLNAGLSR